MRDRRNSYFSQNKKETNCQISFPEDLSFLMVRFYHDCDRRMQFFSFHRWKILLNDLYLSRQPHQTMKFFNEES